MLRRLKNKNGFSLVECIIAMMLMVIMAAMVSMIIMNTVTLQKDNAETREDIDGQVNKLAGGAEADAETKELSGGITFEKPDGTTFTVPFGDDTNSSEALILNRKNIKDSELELGVLEADYTILDESIRNPSLIYGTAVKNITITEAADTGLITWTVSFTAEDEYELTIKLPIGSEAAQAGEGTVTGRTFEISGTDSTAATHTFELKFNLSGSYLTRYENVRCYFGGSGSGTASFGPDTAKGHEGEFKIK